MMWKHCSRQIICPSRFPYCWCIQGSNFAIPFKRRPILCHHHHVPELIEIFPSRGLYVIISGVSLFTEYYAVMLCDIYNLLLKLNVGVMPHLSLFSAAKLFTHSLSRIFGVCISARFLLCWYLIAVMGRGIFWWFRVLLIYLGSWRFPYIKFMVFFWFFVNFNLWVIYHKVLCAFLVNFFEVLIFDSIISFIMGTLFIVERKSVFFDKG